MYSCFIYFGAGPDQYKKPVSLACTTALFLLVLAQTSTKSPSVWHVQLLSFYILVLAQTSTKRPSAWPVQLRVQLACTASGHAPPL